MTHRAGIVWTVIGSILVILLLGRWAALTATERLWAVGLGIGEPHGEIARLQLLLFIAAFVVAAAWCLCHLYVVYRSVESVSIPRQVGNLELLEAIPRRYLRVGVALGCVVLAAVLSRESPGWWYHRALATASESGSIVEPVLGRTTGYYLFDLPWWRELYEFAVSAVGIVLVVAVALYVAAGAIRIRSRRVRVAVPCRVHLGVLFSLLALVLVWGYRLEPAELVGGLHDVPHDAVLTDVRVPTARLLSALSLLAVLGSVLWTWLGRLAPLVAGWLVLGAASVLGHHVVPAFAARVRPPEQGATGVSHAMQDRLWAEAFDLPLDDTTVALAREQPLLPDDRAMLRSAPIWDDFAVRAVLNTAATPDPYQRFSKVYLSVYGEENSAIPVYLGVRELDFAAGAAADGAALSWSDVHLTPYAFTSGVFAVRAADAAPNGQPRFVADLDRADRGDTSITEVVLDDNRVVFSPSARDVAFVSADSKAAEFGVRVGGLWRRLAFAWTLQSPQLVGTRLVPSSASILRHRSVRVRLERVAPFAEFGDPYPVVSGRRLYWIAPGYVSSEVFPLAPAVAWRGRTVRYVNAGFVGVVDALTGRTTVFAVHDADPLTDAWLRLLPDLVQPISNMPEELRVHLRYPEELFHIQAALIWQSAFGAGRTSQMNGADRDGFVGRRVGAPFWWVGGGLSDSIPRLRLSAGIRGDDPQVLSALFDGTLRHGVPTPQLIRFRTPARIPESAALISSEAQFPASPILGTLRPGLVRGRLLYFLAAYLDPGPGVDAAPSLAEVALTWGEGVQRGPSLEAVLRLSEQPIRPVTISALQWDAARRWFRQMDAARQAGDWSAFGRAYDAFREALSVRADTFP